MSKRYYDFENNIENVNELIAFLDENADGRTIVKGKSGNSVDYQITTPKKVFIIYETMEKPYTYYADFKGFAKHIMIKNKTEVFIDGVNYTKRNTYTDIELKNVC